MQLINLILLVIAVFCLLGLNALALAARMGKRTSDLTSAPE